jgi:hypothetical protein
MIAAGEFLDMVPTARIWAGLGLFLQVLFTCSFLLESFSGTVLMSVELGTGLVGVPWEFVHETGLEVTGVACHDWFFITTFVELAGAAIRPQTHGE